ncbi:MAG: hypothetical protein AAF688_08765, partial [Bacteroidota bacterium]
MKPIWNNINKAIAVINLIVGFALLYVVANLSIKQLNYIKDLSEQNKFPKIETSFLELMFGNRILLLIGILSTLSGIFMLLRKKIGWILGFCSVLISILILFHITAFGINDVTTTFLGPKYWIQIYGGLGLLLFLSILILMLSKQIRILYKINRKTWFLSFGIILLIYLTLV